MHYLLQLIGQEEYKHKMVYETNLLDPMWWVNSLLGSATVLVILVELWLLSYVRRIPNIKSFALLLIGIDSAMLIFAVFSGNGISITSGILILIIGIFSWIAFSGFNEK